MTKLRFSATVGQEPEIELALLQGRRTSRDEVHANLGLFDYAGIPLSGVIGPRAPV